MAVTPLDLKAGFCIALSKSTENDTLTIDSTNNLTCGRLGVDGNTIKFTPDNRYDIIVVEEDSHGTMGYSDKYRTYYLKIHQCTTGGQNSETTSEYLKIGGRYKYNGLQCKKKDSETELQWSFITLDNVDNFMNIGFYSVVGDTITYPKDYNVSAIIYTNVNIGTGGASVKYTYYMKTSNTTYTDRSGQTPVTVNSGSFTKIIGDNQFDYLNYTARGDAETTWTFGN